MQRKRILLLFPQEWDELALSQPRFSARCEFVRAGFDLFSFPDNAKLLTFDARRFIDRMVALAARKRIDAVVTTNEQFGALIAATLCKRLGLPGADPGAVITAQHKYYARHAIARHLPHAAPPFAVFPYTVRHADEIGIALPFFVKPVKATFSVLARRVDTFEELRRHLSFHPLERHIIKRLVRPFNDLLTNHPHIAVDAHHLVAEGLLDGLQVNVDGYIENGRPTLIGIVDELLYPGTYAFMRFEYPSSLPTHLQDRVRETAKQAVAALGLDHGFFNVELVVNVRTGDIHVIEINPRLASQFATLYQWVDGIDIFEMMIALALGEPVRYRPAPQHHTHAGSFAFRRFDGVQVPSRPGTAEISDVRQRHPEAKLMFYFKRGASLRREMKWMGSYRYALLNLPGSSLADLHARCADVRRRLGFEHDSGPSPVLAHGGGFGTISRPQPALRE